MKPKTNDTAILLFPSTVYDLAEPLGMCVVLGTWNYPFATTFKPVISAIAAGNCCIIKPSEFAPYSSAVIKDMVDRMDQRYFRCFEGQRETSVHLNKMPFDVLAFTGGTTVGKYIAKDAAMNLTKCVLELGGKNHCVVDKTAGIPLAAKRLANAKSFNCGQTCISVDYIFVDKAISKEFIQALKTEFSLILSEDSKNNEHYGRLIHTTHAKNMMKLLEGQKEKIIYQPGKPDPDNKFVPITIVLNPDLDSPIMQEEIFGPLLPIVEYESFKEVEAFLNRMPKPLTNYYFGDTSTASYKHLRDNCSSGSLMTNDLMYMYVSYSQGFGGVGPSGVGKLDGYRGFLEFSHLKPVIERGKTCLIDPPCRYAPSTPSKLRQLEFIADNFGGKTLQDYTRRMKMVLPIMVIGMALYYLFANEILILNLNK